MRRIPAKRENVNFTATRPPDGAVDKARQLRQDGSPPERVLWNILRREGRRLGLIFRRQHPIGVYVADFYCPSAALVVEVDGSMHAHRGASDGARDEWMRAQGLEIVRVRGDEVCRDATEVSRSLLALARTLKTQREKGSPL